MRGDPVKITNADESAFISFKYDADTVAKIKTLPLRFWLPEEREWEIPAKDVRLLRPLFNVNELDLCDGLEDEYAEDIEDEGEDLDESQILGGESEMWQTFETELAFIKDPKILEFTKAALNDLPSYFYKVAASSTGKYHPAYCLGQGGLVRHTKAVARVANEMFNFNTYWNFTDDQKDMLICSALLHDGCKYGAIKEQYCRADHPTVEVEHIKNNSELCKMIDKKTLKTILGCIESHMSQWNTDWRGNNEILPLPKTDMEKYIGLCDYISARKMIEIQF